MVRVDAAERYCLICRFDVFNVCLIGELTVVAMVVTNDDVVISCEPFKLYFGLDSGLCRECRHRYDVRVVRVMVDKYGCCMKMNQCW